MSQKVEKSMNALAKECLNVISHGMDGIGTMEMKIAYLIEIDF